MPVMPVEVIGGGLDVLDAADQGATPRMRVYKALKAPIRPISQQVLQKSHLRIIFIGSAILGQGTETREMRPCYKPFALPLFLSSYQHCRTTHSLT